jgi:type I restriction enzyme M protein
VLRNFVYRCYVVMILNLLIIFRLSWSSLGITTLDPIALRDASGYVFYNTSDWTLSKLVKTATNNRQILEGDFKAYLDGFSDKRQ